ncbi:hypothetical protein [uncultured Bacteroides sp.]|uniref:hypothetical protein n=1 Tax=uncultured Bacteroides sp. TaxID=162156 RepID=UPI0025DCE16B|nr:hypothetical protein [uncultured Bacteroides sp.]
MAHGKFRRVEAPGDRTGECVPFVPSGFAFPFGHEACGVLEREWEDGTDLYR